MEISYMEVIEVIYSVIKETLYQQFTYQDEVMVDVTIHYPQIAGGSAPGFGKFNEFYLQEAQSLLQYARQTLYPAAVDQYRYAQQNGYPFNNYELLQTYAITCRSCLLSLYADRYEYTGGAHGMTTRTGYTWQPASGRMLALSDLFMEGFDYNHVILQVIEAEAMYRQASGEVQYFDDLTENIHKYYDESNFYLTPQGITIFYPLYTLAPYVAGIQTFTVPYELLMTENPSFTP